MKGAKLWPLLDEHDFGRVEDCLRSGNLWRGNGKYLQEFEKAFSRLHDSEFCLAVTNGTHALELALSSLGIGPGDEVIIPAYTFVATASAVLMRSAIPVPVDIRRDSFCMDPQKIEQAITERTKGIIVVHLAGHPCEMGEILPITRKHRISLIEDCAHAHGAVYKGRKVGSFSEFSAFSFQANKAMTAGEGGALLANTPELYERAFMRFNCGRRPGGANYSHECVASNFRMGEMQAALLLGQVARLQEQNLRRSKHAAYLKEFLADIGGIAYQSNVTPDSLSTNSLFLMVLEGGRQVDRRDRIVERLKESGIEAFRAYPAVHKTGMFADSDEFRAFGAIGRLKSVRDSSFPVAEWVADNGIWLPHYFLLQDIDALKKLRGALIDAA